MTGAPPASNFGQRAQGGTSPVGSTAAGRRTLRDQAFADAIESDRRNGMTTQADASGLFGDTIHAGQINAPKAKNFGKRAQGGTEPVEPGKLAGLSPKEKAARKASWESKVAAKQERARVKAAPSASQFGRNSATNDRGTGLAPLPKAGKTKPKPRSTSGQQR